MMLEGQKAIVTGSADGIGKGIALRLAEEGADIGVIDVNVQGAKEVSEEIRRKGRGALPIGADVGLFSKLQNDTSSYCPWRLMYF